jgi:hypothetical protein
MAAEKKWDAVESVLTSARQTARFSEFESSVVRFMERENLEALDAN